MFFFFFTKNCFFLKKICVSFFLVGEEGWRLANPKPKLVSSLGRSNPPLPQTSNYFGVWGGGNYPSQTSN